MKLSKDISYSQSLIKKFEEENYCPKKIKAMYIDKTHANEPSLSMQKGNYFEYLCIGAAAHNGVCVTDLPRKRKNQKTADQERIEHQANLFPEVLKEFGIEFPKEKNRQVTISHVLDNGIQIEGTFDFCAEINNEEWGHLPVAIIDIKLTSNIHSTFGDFCWGTPENMDLLQSFMYPFIFKERFKDKLPKNYVPPFFYLVFDYKPDSEYKLIQTEYNFAEEEKLLKRVEYAYSQAQRCDELNWAPEPDMIQCNSCPVANAGDCDLKPIIIM
jgi:hypothetical protein